MTLTLHSKKYIIINIIKEEVVGGSVKNISYYDFNSIRDRKEILIFSSEIEAGKVLSRNHLETDGYEVLPIEIKLERII